MKCSSALKQLHELAHNCSSDKITTELREHYHYCPSCSGQLTSLHTMLTLMQDLPAPSLSAEQWQSMHRAVMGKLPSSAAKQQQVKAFSALRVRTVAAILILSFVSFSIFYLSHQKSVPKFSEARYTRFPRVSQIKGTAFTKDIYSGSSENPLDTQSAIQSGRILRTVENSTLNLQVDQLSSIDLHNNSTLEIVACTENVQVFKLEKGNLHAQVGKSSSGRLFRIETPNASCEIIGTRFSVLVEQNPESFLFSTMLSVFEGRVQFKAGMGKVVLVDSGQFIRALNDSCGSPTDLNYQGKTVSVNQSCAFEITTNPSGALVQIDGKYAGITPLTGSALKGEHHLSIVKDQYRSWSGKVSLGTEEQNKFKIALKKESGKSTPSTEIELARISTLIDSGHIDSAIGELRRVYLDNSLPPQTRASALKKAAMCYRLSGKVHESIEALELIVKGPFPSELKESALFQIASLYSADLSDYPGAIKYLKRYTNLYPEGIWAEEAHFTLAELQYVLKNYQEAVSVYRKIVEKFHSSRRIDDALYSLARIYSRDLDNCGNALLFFGRLEADFPKSSFVEDAVFWKADCLLRLGRASQAIDEYGKYLQAYPDGKWAVEVQTRIRKTDISGVR